MNRMLDHGETLPARRRQEPSAFVSAAGLVLGVGMIVLGLIARGIKGATRLLLNANTKQKSRVRMRDENYVRQIVSKEKETSRLLPGLNEQEDRD